MRTAEVLKDGMWVRTRFIDLKKGDQFKLFEEDGKPVYSDEGCSIFIALDDAYVDKEYHVGKVLVKPLRRE